MCDSPSGAVARLLQLQLHVVELFLRRRADGNIHVRDAFAPGSLGKRSLWRENKRCPCKYKSKLKSGGCFVFCVYFSRFDQRNQIQNGTSFSAAHLITLKYLIFYLFIFYTGKMSC